MLLQEFDQNEPMPGIDRTFAKSLHAFFEKEPTDFMKGLLHFPEFTQSMKRFARLRYVTAVALQKLEPLRSEFGGRNNRKLQGNLGCFPHK
jgi:hypothetical protein